MKWLQALLLVLVLVGCANAKHITGRITNGNAAYVGQFPYQVGLSLELAAVSSFWCSGSLIASNWVLTAAHCTHGALAGQVYLGATLRHAAEIMHTISSSDMLAHAGFNTINMRNDIAVIRIPHVEYTARIQPVRLPALERDHSSYVDDFAIVSGWGYTGGEPYTEADQLQWARLQVLSNEACASVYGVFLVVSSNICVRTTDGVSPCQGDSGDPLVVQSSSTQIGLASFGPATDCETGYPAVFTRITSYLDWIQAQTGVYY